MPPRAANKEADSNRPRIRGEQFVANGPPCARNSNRRSFSRVRQGDADYERHADARPRRFRRKLPRSIRSPPSRANRSESHSGADGNLFVTENRSSKIAELDTNGKFSESVTPTRKAGPNGVASGPGPALNVWFTETNVGRVGADHRRGAAVHGVHAARFVGEAGRHRARIRRKHVGYRPGNELGLARRADSHEAAREVHAVPTHRKRAAAVHHERSRRCALVYRARHRQRRALERRRPHVDRVCR